MSENLQVNYAAWGRGDGKKASVDFQALTDFFPFIDTRGFSLISSSEVKYYQGSDYEAKNLILLRFVPDPAQGLGYGREHVSILFDPIEAKIFGVTKMLARFVTKRPIDYKMALERSMEILKKWAPDLIPENVFLPSFDPKQDEEKLVFSPEFKLGKLELNWIGPHFETIQVEKLEKIKGIKIKLYNPANELWTWLIMSETGELITYERDVYWDFSAFCRGTQMWLHDNWLIANQLI